MSELQSVGYLRTHSHHDQILDVSNLASVISPLGLSTFVSDLFGQEPRHFSRPNYQLTPTFSLQEFETLLWSHEAEIPMRLSVTCGEDEVQPSRGALSKDLFRWAVDKYRDGSSLCLERIQEIVPAFAGLASEMAQHFLADVLINAYLLPRHCKFRLGNHDRRAHYFIVQTSGSASWCLTKPHNGGLSMVSGTQASSAQYDLSPGDTLYVPSEWTSSVVSGDDHSLYVWVSLIPSRTIDYILAFLEVSTEAELRLRFTIPRNGADSFHDVVEEALHCLDEQASSLLMHRLARERLLLGLAAKHRPLPGHHLIGLTTAPTLGLDSLVEKPRGAFFALAERGLHADLFVPGLGCVNERLSQPGGLTFPIAALYLLKAILAMNGPFTADDLPDVYSQRCRLEAIRRLVSEGALIACERTQTKEVQP